MRDFFWIPREDRKREWKRPFLEAPSPLENMPWEPPTEESGEDESAERVIIIDI